VAKHVLGALAYMHRNYRMHRDIKSDNVLVRDKVHALIIKRRRLRPSKFKSEISYFDPSTPTIHHMSA
jgi:serine/threonine protein kinase